MAEAAGAHAPATAPLGDTNDGAFCFVARCQMSDACICVFRCAFVGDSEACLSNALRSHRAFPRAVLVARAGRDAAAAESAGARASAQHEHAAGHQPRTALPQRQWKWMHEHSAYGKTYLDPHTVRTTAIGRTGSAGPRARPAFLGDAAQHHGAMCEEILAAIYSFVIQAVV